MTCNTNQTISAKIFKSFDLWRFEDYENCDVQDQQVIETLIGSRQEAELNVVFFINSLVTPKIRNIQKNFFVSIMEWIIIS